MTATSALPAVPGLLRRGARRRRASHARPAAPASPCSEDDLPALAAGVQEALEDRGVNFRSAGGAAEFLVDPVPRVLGAAEWAALEAGLSQRVRALDAFVADTYGPQRAVAEGVVPERLIETSEGYEPAMRGRLPPGGTWVGIAGLDLVRDAAGELLVLEDNLRTPSGFAYAVEARRGAARAPRRPGASSRRARSPGCRAARGHAARGGARGRRGPVRRRAHRRARTTAPRSSTRGPPSSSASRSSSRATSSCAATCCATAVAPSTSSTAARTPTPSRPRSGALLVAAAARRHARPRQRVRHRRGRRQARARLRRGPGALPPRRGAAAALRRDARPVPAGAARARARRARHARRQAAHGHGGVGVVVCAHAERDDVERLRGELRARPEEFIAQPRSRSPCTRR